MNNGDSSTEDFNILDIAEGPDSDGAKGMNILDELNAKETKKGQKDETKTQPYISGAPGQQHTDDPLGYRGNRAQAGIDAFIFFHLNIYFWPFLTFYIFLQRLQSNRN